MFRLAVMLLVLAACDVGSVLDQAAPDAAGGGGGGGGGGGNQDAATVGAQPLSITLTSAPSAGAVYAPSHVLAVWIQNQAGTFVKTIGRHADIRRQHLVAWTQAAGLADVDAVTGATLLTHAPITVSWDLKDRQNTIVPDGTYTIRMEVADLNSTTPAENNQGTFTFVKGAQPEMQTGLTNGGFTNVSIQFAP